jgi:hypothetical protein
MRWTPVFALLLLAACAEAPLGPVTPGSSAAGGKPLFEAQDFAWSTAAGTGAIAGALTYHQGDIHYDCKGGDVLLTPETPWSRDRMLTLYGSADRATAPVSEIRARAANASPGDYARFVRKTTCDNFNRFTFSGLPNGAWYVITVAKPSNGGEAMALTRRVVLRGDLKTVTLN